MKKILVLLVLAFHGQGAMATDVDVDYKRFCLPKNLSERTGPQQKKGAEEFCPGICSNKGGWTGRYRCEASFDNAFATCSCVN